MTESKIHRYLRSRGLHVIVRADTGVTPCEPDQYWSVWVTDSQHQNPSLGRSSTMSTSGQTSIDSLANLIQCCVGNWQEEYDSPERGGEE